MAESGIHNLVTGKIWLKSRKVSREMRMTGHERYHWFQVNSSMLRPWQKLGGMIQFIGKRWESVSTWDAQHSSQMPLGSTKYGN